MLEKEAYHDEGYHVNEYGLIVGNQSNAVLYDEYGVEGLAPDIRRRLAEIHSNNPDIDWNGAREMLIHEGLMYRNAGETSDTAVLDGWEEDPVERTCVLCYRAVPVDKHGQCRACFNSHG